MQTAEKQECYLRALEGGRQPLDLAVETGTAAAGDHDTDSALWALRRVLRAAGADVRLTGIPVTSGAGYGVSLRAPALPAAEGAPASLCRIRSYAPAVKARDRSLDLAVVSLHADSKGDVSALLQAAGAHARRSGRTRIAVVADDAGAARVAQSQIAEFEARHPGLDVTPCTIPAFCGMLVTGGHGFDIAATSAAHRDTVVAIGAALSGTPSLITRIALDPEATRATAGCDVAEALPGLPGLVIAASELLALCGHGDAAARIADAVCRAMEEGVHTMDFAVTHPYGRLVDEAGFADAIIDRIGSAPRTVARHLAGHSAARQGRPRMRVLPGGR